MLGASIVTYHHRTLDVHLLTFAVDPIAGIARASAVDPRLISIRNFVIASGIGATLDVLLLTFAVDPIADLRAQPRSV